jgi:hypothetical protein
MINGFPQRQAIGGETKKSLIFKKGAVGAMKKRATAFRVPPRARAAKKLKDPLPMLEICDAA